MMVPPEPSARKGYHKDAKARPRKRRLALLYHIYMQPYITYTYVEQVFTVAERDCVGGVRCSGPNCGIHSQVVVGCSCRDEGSGRTRCP